ncbi:unnamed protein product [Rhizophagus irregularis]|nr:unnamed protein product [Rhizophagus irregularis]
MLITAVYDSLIIPLPRPLAGKAAGPNGACFRESGICPHTKYERKKSNEPTQKENEAIKEQGRLKILMVTSIGEEKNRKS